MLYKINIHTGRGDQMIDITGKVQESVKESGVNSGLCTVYVPHTTCGLTINENADPDVQRDILMTLDRLVPYDDPNFHHYEGNSAAHIKSGLFGFSQNIIIENGRLLLGTWQGIYLCEFERVKTSRTVYVKIMEG